MVKSSQPGWWGRFTIPIHHSARWTIGPLELAAQHLPGEWRIAWRSGADPLDASLEHDAPRPGEDLMGWPSMSRIALARPGAQLTLRPALADRSVVSRPERPFLIPAGEEVTVYLSTPLWLQLEAGEPAKPILDLPLYRPSDTWFGASTREGESSYASRTFCRLDLAEVAPRPHRATSAVHIRNRADSPLDLQRINLPATHLSLFRDANALLWTQALTLERTSDAVFAPARLASAPPAAAGQTELVCGPRVPVEGNLMVRAFTTLFGP